MELIMIDPRALRENPNPSRRTKSSPQADALMVASLKASGLIQPAVVYATPDGGNELTIHVGSRRVRLAIAADLAEIPALQIDPETEGGLMRELVENVAREPLNPVDLWRAIERLTAEGWTEESIATALALPVRQVKKLRLLAKVLPAMLDHFAKGDMPSENYLATIAAATLAEQAAVWKKHKPTKAYPHVTWHSVSHALSKSRMYARHASFGDDLAEAYGIAWTEDLFAQGDEDNRFTTDVEAFMGAQHEWMTKSLPKRGIVLETDQWGGAKLPKGAERVYGEPKKTDSTGLYLDRNGTVQKIMYRMPSSAKSKRGKGAAAEASDEAPVVATPRPPVTRKGTEIIGQLRTDALHEALRVAPIEDDTLMALLVLAVSGLNVTLRSAAHANIYATAKMDRHAAQLVDEDGVLTPDTATLQRVARSVLIELLSCQQNATDSGIVSRLAGKAIGADRFLPNMASEEYLSCLSRQAIEAICPEAGIQPKARVKDTRAAIVERYGEDRFVHDAAKFEADPTALARWRSAAAEPEPEDDDADPTAEPSSDGGEPEDQEDEGLEEDSSYRIAAE